MHVCGDQVNGASDMASDLRTYLRLAVAILTLQDTSQAARVTHAMPQVQKQQHSKHGQPSAVCAYRLLVLLCLFCSSVLMWCVSRVCVV